MFVHRGKKKRGKEGREELGKAGKGREEVRKGREEVEKTGKR